MIVVVIIFLVFLCIASVMDINSRRVPIEIPMFLFSVQAGYFGSCLYNHSMAKEKCLIAILCAFLIFALCYFCMFFGNLGGADTLLLSIIGFQFSIYAFYTMLFSFLFAVPYCCYIKTKKKKSDYAFVPYICTAYIVTLLLIYRSDPKFFLT